MKYTYTELKDKFTNEITYIYRSDNSCIPVDPANSDYQVYLKYLEDTK